jgi:hypothetical protein
MNRVWLLLALSALVLLPAFSARADCPDVVRCYKLVGMHTDEVLGKIHVPTCWKFGKGCKPWHCSGQWEHTNEGYWKDQCNKRVPQCRDHPGGCKVDFPRW